MGPAVKTRIPMIVGARNSSPRVASVKLFGVSGK